MPIFSFVSQRPAAGGEGCRSTKCDEIPESEGLSASSSGEERSHEIPESEKITEIMYIFFGIHTLNDNPYYKE